MLIESYLILVVMSFVIGDHLGFTWGSFPCSLWDNSVVHIALALWQWLGLLIGIVIFLTSDPSDQWPFGLETCKFTTGWRPGFRRIWQHWRDRKQKWAARNLSCAPDDVRHVFRIHLPSLRYLNYSDLGKPYIGLRLFISGSKKIDNMFIKNRIISFCFFLFVVDSDMKHQLCSLEVTDVWPTVR